MSLFGGGNTKTTASEPKKLGGMNIQSAGYGNVVPLVFGRCRVPVTLVFYGNFKSTPVMSDTKARGGKGGKKPKQTLQSYNYTAAIMLGIAADYITGTGKLWVDKKVIDSVSQRGFSVFDGSHTAAWGYLLTYEPAKAVELRGFAYMAVDNYALSDNASIGNHSVEVYGKLCEGFEGDANPGLFLPTVLRDECGVPPDRIGNVGQFYTHCATHDKRFSFALTEQKQASDFIAEITYLTSSEMVLKGGLFYFIPYAEAEQTGIDVSSDDFIAEQGEAYLKPTRKKSIDCYNALKIEFISRLHDYNIEVVEAKDTASIESIGLRAKDTIQAHCICHVGIASNIAQQLLSREICVRNSYEFSLSLRYVYLELMDVITITDPILGLYGSPVIIKKIVITPDFLLKITAEDYVDIAYSAITNSTQSSSEPFIPNYDASVGDINQAIIFVSPTLTSELWCAISNNAANYGGCDIYVSTDGGTSYHLIGSHAGETRMGIVTAMNASSMTVDLTQSNAVLNSVDQLAFDARLTLSRVGNEFIVYKDANLTALNQYQISTLQRGLYDSQQTAANGNSFIRCDDSLFKFAYPVAYQGATLKLKFVAYNSFGNGQQDLATVPFYEYTLDYYWDGILTWDNNIKTWD